MDCHLDSEHILQVSSEYLQYNNRDITKCHSCCTTTLTTDDDAKAIAIPRFFSKNSHTKTVSC